MKTIILSVVMAVVSYLIGSLSMSVIFSNALFKNDLRNEGSHNAGATNMARVFGAKAGIIVLVLDLLKGTVCMLLAYFLGKAFQVENVEIVKCIAGGFALLGHAFPIFFKFKGGKAVSTGAGLMLVIDYKVFLMVIVVFIICFIITRIVSISSIISAISLTTCGVLCFIFNAVNLGVTRPEAILCIFCAVFIIIMHHSNIKRLIKGEEKKFQLKKKENTNAQ